MLGWLVRRTGRADLAADLAAETFAAAYLSSGRFRDGPEPALAWLLGIARNKLLTSLRHDRVEQRARRRLGMEPLALDDEALRRVEGTDARLLALVEGLPPELRDAVRARVMDEKDYREVAARLQVSEALARKRVSRGIAALRARMQEADAP